MTLSQVIMYDSVDITQIPVGPAAVAGYVDGAFANIPALAARFPHAKLLTIAVTAAHDADALDVEQGDATPGDVPAWHKRQQERGVTRPCIYASVSVMQEQVIPILRQAGIPRADVRLWAAHYAGIHICGPSTCGELGIDADACQHTDRAFGRNLDQSLLVADFFAGAPVNLPTAPSAPPWQEAMLNQLPVLSEGAQDHPGTVEFVYRLRAYLAAYGQITGLQGAAALQPGHVFDASTKAAVQQVQEHGKLTVDGICGTDTWTLLITGAA